MKKAESMNIEPYNLILLTKLTPLVIGREATLAVQEVLRLRRETEQEFHDCLFAE